MTSVPQSSSTSIRLSDVREFCRQWEPANASLISVDKNTMLAAWTMPVAWEPLTLMVSIGKNRHTHSLLEIGETIWIARPSEIRYEEAKREFGWKSGKHGPKLQPHFFAKDGIMHKFKIDKLIDVGDHTLVLAVR